MLQYLENFPYKVKLKWLTDLGFTEVLVLPNQTLKCLLRNPNKFFWYFFFGYTEACDVTPLDCLVT